MSKLAKTLVIVSVFILLSTFLVVFLLYPQSVPSNLVKNIQINSNLQIAIFENIETGNRYLEAINSKNGKKISTLYGHKSTESIVDAKLLAGDDKQRILFTLSKIDNHNPSLISLYIVNPDGRNKKLLAENIDSQVKFEGYRQKVAYATPNSLHILNLETGEDVVVLEYKESAYQTTSLYIPDIVWSEDGENIIVTLQKSDDPDGKTIETYLINTKTSEVEKVSEQNNRLT